MSAPSLFPLLDSRQRMSADGRLRVPANGGSGSPFLDWQVTTLRFARTSLTSWTPEAMSSIRAVGIELAHQANYFAR